MLSKQNINTTPISDMYLSTMTFRLHESDVRLLLSYFIQKEREFVNRRGILPEEAIEYLPKASATSRSPHLEV